MRIIDAPCAPVVDDRVKSQACGRIEKMDLLLELKPALIAIFKRPAAACAIVITLGCRSA